MEENKNIFVTPLEDLMGDRFGKYAKYIIQDRALPDVRDGLKPVQRRIIYAMYEDNNIFGKPYKKSATAVGNVMGRYHPHGDSSIYDAMVRMSQDWKSNTPFIDMQGNNGSIDDDPAAAYRYTEARLSAIALELMRDIDKNTVNFAPNYSDTLQEPTVLPSKFPNLLVNGAEGISAGYSTSIPPHNFEEVCKAAVYRIKNPHCSLEEIMEIIPGPDFPTGGIIRGKEGIVQAFKTGGGQVQMDCKYHLEQKKTMTQMIVEEIPFGQNKKKIVTAIDEIRVAKEVDGIIEVRDESGRDGLRICIDIKNEANVSAIVNYLMKKTKLSEKYTYNMVVICDKRPVKIGILALLDYYIKHQIEVINRRTKFDLAKTKQRYHILNGMAIAISSLDDLIDIVRTSHSKDEMKKRIMAKFNLDEDQAEAIVTIQLHRLNSVDVQSLYDECKELKKLEEELNAIVDNERRIRTIIAKELEEIIKKYPCKRRSAIEDEVQEYVVEKKPIIKEDCMINITRDGYFKRSTMKSFNSSDGALPSIKNGDIIVGLGLANTADTLLCFTDLGNYIYVPVHELTENKWKDEGKHISNVVNLSGQEKIIKAILVKDFDTKATVVLLSKDGSIKKTPIADLVLTRYNKPSIIMKLGDNDKVVGVGIADGDSTFIVESKKGKVLQYHETKVNPVGARAGGVIAMKLDDGDELASLVVVNKSNKLNCVLFTDRGGYKIFNTASIPTTNKTVKPIELFKYYRAEPHYLVSSLFLKDDTKIYALTNKDLKEFKFDEKASPIGKTIKPSLWKDKNEVLIALSDTTLDVIDSSFKTYEPTVEEIQSQAEAKVEKEEKTEKTLTIFDLLGDFDD